MYKYNRFSSNKQNVLLKYKTNTRYKCKNTALVRTENNFSSSILGLIVEGTKVECDYIIYENNRIRGRINCKLSNSGDLVDGWITLEKKDRIFFG